MPSSSKVSGSLCLCALAYILFELAKPQFIEDFNFGYFTYVNMLVGVIIGWVLMGKRAGFGLVFAINNGVTSTFSMVLVVIFIQSANEMIRLSMRGRYDGLVEALLEIIPIGIDFVVKVSSTALWGTALIGGIVAGLIVEAIWHRVH
ncbi:TrgA family protein [Ascidiaceihabitans sp.]|nr:TrgA family protein [Ascidiaceihabitans sp.]MDA9136030.1 TrgA family protein [Ascidiaceihabitans sp.]